VSLCAGVLGIESKLSKTIVPYTIEEAYDVADAVARRDMADLREELGDLLLQVVFQSRIAEERACFDFGAVVEVITQKMIRRRHPHVFGEARDLTPEQRKALWSAIKTEEKTTKKEAERGTCDASASANQAPHKSLLDDVPIALAGLTRAVKLQAKAASVGFDWNDASWYSKRFKRKPPSSRSHSSKASQAI
jgi:ATP diphosphatase